MSDQSVPELTILQYQRLHGITRGGACAIGLCEEDRQNQTHRLELALSQLTPNQRSLFQRHCIEGETVVQIAATRRCSTESLRHSFCRLRRQLQTLLMQTGLDPREAMDCLYQALTRHP